MVTKRFLVRGQVQGVGYRYFALKTAEDLGVTGFARNMLDGSVEVVAAASDAVLAHYEEMLRKGPAFARVASVEAAAAPERGDLRFEVR
jgi:acylphosphatase